MKLHNNKKHLTTCIQAALFSLLLANCGGGSGSTPDNSGGEVAPKPTIDTTPNSYNFSDQTDVVSSTAITSNEITISGINSDAAISIVGGEYSIDGGAFTSTTGTISDGQKVIIKLTSSDADNTQSDAVLTIGGITDTFSATTAEKVVTPAPSGINVDINFNVRHTVGGIDTFDRQKFITIHASPSENDWGENDGHTQNSANADPDLMINFVTDNDVYFGRDTGSIGWALRNVREDSVKTGFVDEATATAIGGDFRWSYANNSAKKFADARAVEHRALDMIMGGQQHPYWPEATTINPVVNSKYSDSTPWSFSQTNTQSEPLGTATGHYFGQYLSKFFRNNIADSWRIKPKYFEIMNEPLYDLTTVRDPSDANYVSPLEVFEFHNTAKLEIHKVTENSDINVGGYTVAFPNFEVDNFQRWEDRDKLFIDTSGEKMDFYSIHLYDFPRFKNSERYRKGSNVEATFDMLEHYTMMTLGETKPVIISEYGAAIHTMFNQGWSPLRNTLQMRALNSMLMSFLERPNTIAKTIPFNVIKAEWGRTTVPYGPRLMVQEFERTSVSSQTDWVYSDLILFYNLWAEVKGTRVDTWSSDADIQVDAYIDGDDAYIILNNLEFDEAEVNLHALGIDTNDIAAVNIKHMVSTNDTAEASSIDETDATVLPSSVTLDGEGTMIIKVTYASDITIDQTNEEAKYYATTYKQPITASDTINFSIDDVVVGSQGEAVLRLGIGRDHGKSLKPTVTVNGNTVLVPIDFRGYDQVNGRDNTGRESFYGVIEIPVAMSALNTDNTIAITFSDSGGFVASAALQVFSTSKVLTRTQ